MITAISEVTMKTHTIVIIIFPSLLGCFMLEIEDDIVTNIKGTIATNIRFKKTSPSGLSTAAFSLNTIPMIAPTIIAAHKLGIKTFIHEQNSIPGLSNKILKRKVSILKWKNFKYFIYEFTFCGLMLFCIVFSFHAILLLLVPSLMVAQYKYNKRDLIFMFAITIVFVPVIYYGSFIFGIEDRNLLKNMLEAEEVGDISARIRILTSQRALEVLLHYVFPMLLAVIAIDFLLAAIVIRNKNMLDGQVKLAQKVKEESEKSSLIQQTVIEELASVIETRDVNTGEHVRRTTEYVRIICNKLATLDEYKDILTEDTINNIVSAAPLHDIGKIAVSDLILLKPGRLTKEEFDLMKVHASKGGEMIKEFFSKFEDDDFINEAYQIAAHHHEKWDGSGYPSALKENEIPLSARIMAISDVFDALVSKRVYKDAMPLEDAFNVLIEESGHHFDPSLIEAVKSVKEEFFEIANNMKDK